VTRFVDPDPLVQIVFKQTFQCVISESRRCWCTADNYWSMPLQPGSAFNRNSDPWHPSTLNSTHEPYNEMQSAISSYTTAQVAPSDGVGAQPQT